MTAEKKDTDRKLSDIQDTAESTRDGMIDFAVWSVSQLTESKSLKDFVSSLAT